MLDLDRHVDVKHQPESLPSALIIRKRSLTCDLIVEWGQGSLTRTLKKVVNILAPGCKRKWATTIKNLHVLLSSLTEKPEYFRRCRKR